MGLSAAVCNASACGQLPAGLRRVRKHVEVVMFPLATRVSELFGPEACVIGLSGFSQDDAPTSPRPRPALYKRGGWGWGLDHGGIFRARVAPSFIRSASSRGDHACRERAGRCQPANRCLRYVEAPSHICLRFAISKPLYGLPPLMRRQRCRSPEFHATGLRSCSALSCAGND
jgi:hypothetical protein